jgi:hypothetical protein
MHAAYVALRLGPEPVEEIVWTGSRLHRYLTAPIACKPPGPHFDSHRDVRCRQFFDLFGLVGDRARTLPVEILILALAVRSLRHHHLGNLIPQPYAEAALASAAVIATIIKKAVSGGPERLRRSLDLEYYLSVAKLMRCVRAVALVYEVRISVTGTFGKDMNERT